MQTEPLPYRWKSLFVLLASGFQTMLAVSILNVSVPSLSETLGLTGTGIQWVMAGYMLAGGLGLVPSGRLGDAYGRRFMFIISVFLFGLSSILGGLAINAVMLISARIIEGISSAMAMPQVIGLIQELFTGSERVKAFGYLGATVGISTAIGPTTGGILLALLGPNFGWRAAFFLNIPICIVVITLAFKLLPSDRKQNDGARLDLDPLGLFLLAAATLLVMLPFIIGSEHGQTLRTIPWYLLGAGILVAALFIGAETLQEKRKKDVIAPKSLLLDPSYMIGTIILAVYFAGFSAIFLVYTIYLQEGLGLAPWKAGLLQIPIAIGTAIFSSFSSRLLMRYGRWSLVISNSIVIFGFALTLAFVNYLPPQILPYALLGSVFFIGMGSGLLVPSAQSLSLMTVPVAIGGTAGGLSQTAQAVARAIGLAMVTMLFYLLLGNPATTPVHPEAARLHFTYAFSGAVIAILVMQFAAIVISTADALKRPDREGLV